MQGQLANAYAWFITELWNTGSSAIAPRDLKYKIGNHIHISNEINRSQAILRHSFRVTEYNTHKYDCLFPPAT